MTEDVKVIISAVDQASGTLGKVGDSVVGLNRKTLELGETLARAGAGFAMVGVAETVRRNIASLAELDDAAAKTGASVEKLSALFDLAKSTGFDTGVVEASMVKLAVSIDAASDKSGKAAKSFAALGLAQSDLAGKDTAESLKLVADRMAQYADGSGKTALAVALLGKSGADALPYLKDLAETQQLVGSASTAAAAQAAKFEDQFSALSVAAGNIGRSFASGLLPTLTDIAESFTDGGGAAEGFALSAEPLAEALKAITIVGGNVAFVFKAIGTEIGGIAAQMAALGRGDFAAFGAIGDMMKTDAEAARKAFDAWEARVLAAGSSAGPSRAAAAPETRPQLAFDDSAASEAAVKQAKDAAAARLRVVEAGIAAEVAAVKAGEKEKLDLISHAEKLGTLSLEQAGQARVQAVAEAVSEEVGELIKLAQARQAAGDVKGYADAEKQIADAMRRVAGASREAAQALALFDKAQRDAFYGQQMQEVAAIDQVSEGLRAQALALKEQAQFFGMTEEAIYRYRAAQVEAAIVVEDGALADSAKNEALRDQAAAYRDLADASASVAGKQLAKKEADEAAAAWKDFSRDIEQSLTDALYRSFEAGGDFGEAFARNLENTFKTMALKAAIQYVVSYAGNAASAFVGGATNGAVGNAGSAAGQWGGTLVSAGGKWVYSQASPYIDSAAGWFGMGASSVGGISTAGTSAGLTMGSGSGLGLSAGSGSYGLQASANSTAGASGGAAGASGTSWLPIIGWIAAGMMAANSLSKQGLGYQGAQYDALNDKSGGWLSQSAGNINARTVRSLGGSDRLADILSAAPIDNNLFNWAFGKKTDIAGSGLQLDIRDGKLTSGMQFQDWWSGGGRFHGSEFGTNFAALSGGQSEAIQGMVEAAVKGFIEPFNKAFSTELDLDLQFRDSGDKLFSAIDKALVKSIENSDVRDLFVGITDASGMMAALQSFANVQTMLEAINQNADIKSAGTLAVGMGSEQLTASLSGYYEAFFSEQEKAQKRADDLAQNWAQNAAKFADPVAFLGGAQVSAVLPKTEAEFRQLVEALDLTSESGRAAFAYLMQIAPAFDLVATAAEAMAAQLAEAAAREAERAQAYRRNQADAALLFLNDADLLTAQLDRMQSAFAAAGLAAPTTAADYRGLIGAQDAGSASGQANLDLLGEWSDVFGQMLAEQTITAELAAQAQLDAQERIRNGWQSTADSIADIMRRLRGELVGEGERGFAAAQAEFAIATAAARAGDQAAAASLPELARAVVDLGREVATSSLDQARLTAATLSSLSATVGGLSGYGIALPQFAVGTNFVPADMVAQIHQGERIIPAGDNARLMQSSDDLLAELRILRAEVVSLRAETRAVASNTFDAALVLRRVVPSGDAIEVRVVA